MKLLKPLVGEQCEERCDICKGLCLQDKGHNVKRKKHICFAAHEWPK